jgi:UDP-N-acetyl-D-mannosaminuronate dehydrogenase
MLALDIGAKEVRGSWILLLSLPYKANVDDDRESSSFRLMKN